MLKKKLKNRGRENRIMDKINIIPFHFPAQENSEEYVVPTFSPQKCKSGSILLRRAREEKLRKLYCHPNVKTKEVEQL